MEPRAQDQEAVDSLQGILNAKRGVDLKVLEDVLVLAVEIAREGREGRKIGTMFVVGDAEKVLQQSRCLILDPLAHHAADQKKVDESNLRETVKELAQLDGAFIVSDDGIVVSACRHINVSVEGVELPLGLGSRHMAAASVSKRTKAVVVVVSESSIVRVVDNGEIVGEIIPELWLLRNSSLHQAGSYSARKHDQVTVLSKEE